MKRYILSFLEHTIPTGVKSLIFKLGVHLMRSDFQKLSYRYAFAPNMELGLIAARDRGLMPSHLIDIGAYHGDFTRILRRIWPNSSILMIEANTDKKKILDKVASSCKADVQFAILGSEEGKQVTFNVMESGSSVFEENSPLPRRVEIRNLRTLDSILEGRPADLIKLDVQGYELEVLRGAELAMSQAKAIILEVALIEINKGAPLLSEVVEFMDKRGFRVADILGLHRRPLDRATNQVDLLFVPHDSPLFADTRHFA